MLLKAVVIATLLSPAISRTTVTTDNENQTTFVSDPSNSSKLEDTEENDASLTLHSENVIIQDLLNRPDEVETPRPTEDLIFEGGNGDIGHEDTSVNIKVLGISVGVSSPLALILVVTVVCCLCKRKG